MCETFTKRAEAYKNVMWCGSLSTCPWGASQRGKCVTSQINFTTLLLDFHPNIEIRATSFLLYQDDGQKSVCWIFLCHANVKMFQCVLEEVINIVSLNSTFFCFNMLDSFTESCLTTWLFVFHVCHRAIRFHVDFVFSVVECHSCSRHSLTQQLIGYGFHCLSWLASHLLFPPHRSSSSSPHTCCRVSISELRSAWAQAHISLCVAPVCNKRRWQQMDMLTCWACLVCRSD